MEEGKPTVQPADFDLIIAWRRARAAEVDSGVDAMDAWEKMTPKDRLIATSGLIGMEGRGWRDVP
jgi:hypothetical protein